MVEHMPGSQKSHIQISVLFAGGGGGAERMGSYCFGYRVSAWENEKVLKVMDSNVNLLDITERYT